MLIASVADHVYMTGLIALLLLVAALVAFGLLAVRYGTDSRHTDPRSARSNWF